jgi:hypothetical protein
MKQRLLVALLTVLVFSAGFMARVWTERQRPLPPPPATLMSEFAGDKNAQAQKPPAQKPFDRAQFIADIEKFGPQIEAYRKRIETMDCEFDEGFARLLNPEQKAILDAKIARDQKKRAEHEAKAALTPPAPLTDEEIAKLRQRPFEAAFWKISFTGRLESTVKEFKLDAQQEAATRQLLAERREKFVALVDSTPPPTFKLIYLAAAVQRLVDPAAAPAQSAKPATPSPAK